MDCFRELLLTLRRKEPPLEDLRLELSPLNVGKAEIRALASLVGSIGHTLLRFYLSIRDNVHIHPVGMENLSTALVCHARQLRCIEIDMTNSGCPLPSARTVALLSEILPAHPVVPPCR